MRLLFILICFATIACQNQMTTHDDNQGMAQHAHDKDFVEKHEIPPSINYQAEGDMITFPTDDGKHGSAYALMTAEASDNYLLVIHEWWGLNDQIKQEADRLFAELGDVNVLALDLYDGEVTADPSQAGQIMSSRNVERLRSIVRGALTKAGENARIATIGWCFGGGWSIHSAHIAGDQAVGCVMYYGRLPLDMAKEMDPIQTDVLGIFAEQDQHITLEYAKQLKGHVESVGQQMTIHAFDADHAFANPSSPRYNEDAAQEANSLALTYLKDKFNL